MAAHHASQKTESIRADERWRLSISLSDNASITHRDPSFSPGRNVHVMSYDDKRGSAVMNLVKYVKDDLGGCRVQVASGLIGDNHFRFPDQGACNGNPLLLASRELARHMIESSGDAEPFREFSRVRTVRRDYARGGELTREQDVVDHRDVRDKIEGLENKANIFVSRPA